MFPIASEPKVRGMMMMAVDVFVYDTKYEWIYFKEHGSKLDRYLVAQNFVSMFSVYDER